MSKSTGNFLTLNTLKDKNINPLSYRYFCLLSHYRKTLDFSFNSLNIAEKSYYKLLDRINNLKIDDNNLMTSEVEVYIEKFKSFLEDDLNTSSCITLLYDILKDKNINNFSKIHLFEKIDEVLSLNLVKNNSKEINTKLKEYINDMIIKRNLAKEKKDYKTADKIRETLEKEGIILKDTREGTLYNIRRGK